MSDPFANLPRGHFGAGLADPPWRFSTWSAKGRDRCPDAPLIRNESRNNRPERHYQTMTLDEIKALPVGDIFKRHAVLGIWAVDAMIPHALEVGAAWGFTFKTVLYYWMKLRRKGSKRGLQYTESDMRAFPLGTGYWTRPNPEQCLLFTRGQPKRVARDVRKLIVSPRREHSRKPDEARERLELLVAGPYIELFGRQSRPNWTTWGNEATKFDKEPPRESWDDMWKRPIFDDDGNLREQAMGVGR